MSHVAEQLSKQDLPERVGKCLESLRWMVGDTPLFAIRVRVRGREFVVHAKYEISNFTGSIKDRMALHMIAEAYSCGRLKEGDTIAEATSGNTGISFSAMGRVLGHPVRIYMPDWMSMERVHLIRGLSASVIPVSNEQGGFLGSIAMADHEAELVTDVFRPHQFSSGANLAAHARSTGPELVAQMAALDCAPSAFVAGVGTGGTVMGVGAHLKGVFGKKVTIHPLEPANSPTLREGKKVGKHRIQGISDEFIPELVNLHELDPIVDVWDGDAILMAQSLSRVLGLGVGISSGANMLGAIKVALQQGKSARVATVFADSNKKYLSTDLCSDEEMKPKYLTHEVELLDFQVIPRSGAGFPVF
ncbi:MAG: cysteine synthase A [Candidatus Paceibacteria bacterium]|jgi:cysteine synthase A